MRKNTRTRHLILTKKIKIIWVTHNPTQTKPETSGFAQTHPLI